MFPVHIYDAVGTPSGGEDGPPDPHQLGQKVPGGVEWLVGITLPELVGKVALQGVLSLYDLWRSLGENPPASARLLKIDPSSTS